MRQATETRTSPGEKIVKDIKRATRKHYSSEEKIRIVLDGLRGEDSIAELCRREGISQGIYYKWSKDFMEAGKRQLAGDTIRATTTDEVKDLRRAAYSIFRAFSCDSKASDVGTIIIFFRFGTMWAIACYFRRKGNESKS